MKQFLLAVIISSITFSLSAQILTIEPIPVEETFNVDLTNEILDLEMHATVTNNTNEEIQLKWVRQVIDKPQAWRSQVCDNNTCYVEQVSTNYDPDNGINEPAILGAGQSFDLIFHVLPNQTAGTGEFRVSFYLISDLNTVLETAVFMPTVSGLTSTNDLIKPRIKAFPNPAQDYIELTSNNLVDELVVYNIIGHKVRSFRAQNGKKYDIADLPDGLYLISLVNDQNGIVKTLRISKRSLRP